MDRNFGSAVGARNTALIGCAFISIAFIGGTIGFGIFYLLYYMTGIFL